MSSLLDLLYGGLLTAWIPRAVYESCVKGKSRGGWSQKIRGKVPARQGTRRCIWLHGVSVGEILALRTLVSSIRKRFPEWDVVISSTTTTGMEVAQKSFPELNHIYFPFDFTWSVKRALSGIRPDVIVLAEQELWPQFIREAERRNVPVALINGRMSPRSFRQYRRFRWLTRKILRSLALIAVQNKDYAERFVELGASDTQMLVTGSVKYDAVETDRKNKRTETLRKCLNIRSEETVFIAGSTQDPEEQFCIDTYLKLRERFSELRLVIVPRHPERFEEVASMVQRMKLPLLRRSEMTSRNQWSPSEASGAKQAPVILIDTLGELASVWGLADIAFVGGSLSGRGGQNMIEPAAYGAAVMFGPDTWNFRETVESLTARDAVRVVKDKQELQEAVAYFLDNPQEVVRYGKAAQEFVTSQQGGTTRTVNGLVPFIEDAPNRRHSPHFRTTRNAGSLASQ